MNYEEKKQKNLILESVYINTLQDLLKKDWTINKEYKTKHYDLTLKGGTTVEVKEQRTGHFKDGQFKYTGNFVVEFSCSGKPSGINTSAADFWWLINIDTQKEKVYVVQIEKEELKDYASRCPIVRGGDEARAKMNKIALQPFLKHPDYKKEILLELELKKWEQLKEEMAKKMNITNYKQLIEQCKEVI